METFVFLEVSRSAYMYTYTCTYACMYIILYAHVHMHTICIIIAINTHACTLNHTALLVDL